MFINSNTFLLQLYYLEASNGLVLSTEGEVRESGTHVVLAKKQVGQFFKQFLT